MEKSIGRKHVLTKNKNNQESNKNNERVLILVSNNENVKINRIFLHER